MKPYASYKPSGVPWLGDVPGHWQVEKVKFQARLRGEKAVGTNGVRYVGMEHVLSKVGKFNPVVEGTQEEAESTVNVFSKGDVLFGKLRPYLAKCVVADTDGVCSSEFLVLAPSDEVAPAYLNATMLMQEFIDAVDASTFGAKMPRADWGFIGQQRLPLPPPDEQQAIADYLDAETARIDTLIHEKDELIELLREWRQSVIAEAVTKGLDKTVVMKPSDVPWLGNVPVNWVEAQIRHVTSRVTDGAHVSPDTSSPDMPFVSTVDIKNEKIDFENCLGTTSASYEIMKRTGCKPLKGDVLFSKDGTIGRTCVVDYEREFVVASSLVIISPEIDEIESRYLSYWLNSSLLKQNYELLLAGAALRRISIEKVSRLPVFLPTISEQKAIADYLDAQTAKIDDLIAHTFEEITLLKELRAATIADAVLGRVDVRTAPKQ